MHFTNIFHNKADTFGKAPESNDPGAFFAAELSIESNEFKL